MVARSQRKVYFTYNGGPVFRLGETASTQTAVLPTPQPASDERASAENDPKTANDFSRRGAASAARRDFAAASADFTKAIELEPNEASHYRDRAMARLNNRQPVLAMGDLSQTLKLKPDDLQALITRGELLLSQKDPAAAQADFDAALKLAPSDTQLPLQFARAYTRARLFETAIGKFGAWIEAHPKDDNLASAFAGRCRARALWGKELQSALADCDEALKHAQKISVYMDSRALVLLRLGRFDDAIDQYDGAIQVQPKDAWSLYGRGLAKLKKGATAQGQADIASAIAAQPNIARETKGYGLAPDDATLIAQP